MMLLIIGALAIAGAAYFMLSKKKTNVKVFDKPGVVRLHIWPRAPMAPNLSGPCLKLWTYLRIAKVPYEVKANTETSSKGKMPWIELEGKAIADSEFCIEAINERFNIDLDGHLSKKERSIAHTYRKMLEESVYWGIVCKRWMYKFDILYALMFGDVPFPFNLIISLMVRRGTVQQAKAQGYGRHTEKEVEHIMLQDAEALSMYLGDNAFFTGDKVASVDAIVFAQLAMLFCEPFEDDCVKEMKTKFPNLVAYVNRMKKTYWPDWEEEFARKKK
eukprot:m.339969 g.339969  ORF g.339969 m.339969 type:complete len:274 (+) comp19061_c0_seq1:123-944(+)